MANALVTVAQLIVAVLIAIGAWAILTGRNRRKGTIGVPPDASDNQKRIDRRRYPK
jgi:hypothetical protein